jgi:hypothetical protein
LASKHAAIFLLVQDSIFDALFLRIKLRLRRGRKCMAMIDHLLVLRVL